MFTDGIRVLAGYQTKLEKIGGFGGKSHPGESRIETALRETIEELFGVVDVPVDLLAKLPRSDNYIEYPEYTCFVYNFDDLQTFIRRTGRYVNTPFYSTFPETVWDLIQKRVFPIDAEVGELFLIPAGEQHQVVSRAFQRDLREAGF